MRYITTLASLFIICFNLSFSHRVKDRDYPVTGGVLPYNFVYDNGIGSVTTDLKGRPTVIMLLLL